MVDSNLEIQHFNTLNESYVQMPERELPYGEHVPPTKLLQRIKGETHTNHYESFFQIS